MSRYMSRAGRTCEVKTCGQPVFARLWCKRHYHQVIKYGKVVRVEHRLRAQRKPSAFGSYADHVARRVEVCRESYNNACGVEARLRMRGLLARAESELNQLKKGAA